MVATSLRIILFFTAGFFSSMAAHRNVNITLPSYLLSHHIISITPLKGGESYDQVFKIETEKEIWVLRILNLKRSLEKRRLICEATKVIGENDLGPKVVWHDGSYKFLMTEFLNGKPLTSSDIKNPLLFSELVLLLRRAHDVLKKIPVFIEVYSLRDRVLQRLKEVSLYSFDLTFLKSLKTDVEKVENLPQPHLIHGDIKGANILKTSSGLFLIDLGEASLSSVYDDLGFFAFHFNLTKAQEKKLLELYFGPLIKKECSRRLNLYRWLAEMHDNLWRLRHKLETHPDSGHKR